MRHEWTPEEDEAILRKRTAGSTFKSIQSYLWVKFKTNVSEDAVRLRIKRMTSSRPTTVVKKVLPEDTPITEQPSIQKKIKSIPAALKSITTTSYSKGFSAGKTRKVVSISDLHGLFAREDLIEDVIKEESDADILVINGDLFDSYSLSFFSKYRQYVLYNEYKFIQKLITRFSEIFPLVIINAGNHDLRVIKHVYHSVNPNVFFLLNVDPIEKIQQGYVIDDVKENSQLVKTSELSNVIYDKGVNNWWTKIGKAIFAHPSRFSKLPLKTSELVLKDYVFPRYGSDVDLLVLGHTHRQGTYVTQEGVLLMEQGCMCHPMDYQNESKARYGRQVFGYSVVHMDAQGNVDFNKTRNVFKGSGTILKGEEEVLRELFKY